MLIVQSGILSAQVEILPLGDNPAVQKAYQDKNARWESFATQHSNASRVSECAAVTAQDVYGNMDVQDVYVVSGTTREFCINQLQFDLLENISCENCDELVSGTATIDSIDYCIRYSANAGFDIDFTDTLIITTREQENNSTTLRFPIIIQRAGMTLVAPLNILSQEEEIDICLPQINLPGNTYNYFSNQCSSPRIGIEGRADSCFTYLSKRFAERDTICIEVCDEYCICDEYLIPVQIEAPISTLPFFDDFSYPGPFPDPTKWLDDRIYVNNSFAHRPPSIGVATFDGVSEEGTPYGNGYGPSDFLTSTYFDLSGFTPLNNNIHLSFYLAPKGKTYAPNPEDSIALEFRRSDGDWEEIATFRGIDVPNFDFVPVDSFFYSFEVDDIDFLHDAFQFRFFNKCQRIGIQYTWHLDYVRLANADVDSLGSLEDLAFSKEPTSPLKNFNHLPYRQFEGNEAEELTNQVEVELFNNFDEPKSVTSSELTLTDLESGTTLFSDISFIDPSSSGPTFPSQVHSNLNISVPFGNAVNMIPAGAEKLILETAYELNNTNEVDGTFPEVKENNFVTRLNYIDDFYGYDDGSAELSVATLSENGALAVEYTLNQPDEINGFQVYFPRYGNGQSADDEFILKIYEGELPDGSDPNDAKYISPEYQILYPDQVTPSIAQLTKYRLYDDDGNPTSVPVSGTFYIVLEQAFPNGNMIVGLDLDSERFMNKCWYFETNPETWSLNNRPGAYMIRPVLSDSLADETATNNLEEILDFQAFPNPADDEITVVTTPGDYSFNIFDIYGRTVYQGKLIEKITVRELNPGLYYLQLKDRSKGTSGVQKIQILR